tara:strand:- start:316 stop:480 length:165 start_codon:yes stop_codon:yes gene_type:complete
MISRLWRKLMIWQIRLDVATWNKVFPKERIRVVKEEEHKALEEAQKDWQNYFRE